MRSSLTALKSIPLPSHARPPAGPWYGPATRSNVQVMVSSPSLPHRYTGNLHPRAVNRVVGCHIERAPVLIAPGEVRAVPWNFQSPEKPALRVDHVHAARSRAVHVAVDVDLHAVSHAGLGTAQLVEQTAGPDASVGVHVERANDAEAAVVHIKHFLVGRK